MTAPTQLSPNRNSRNKPIPKSLHLTIKARLARALAPRYAETVAESACLAAVEEKRGFGPQYFKASCPYDSIHRVIDGLDDRPAVQFRQKLSAGGCRDQVTAHASRLGAFRERARAFVGCIVDIVASSKKDEIEWNGERRYVPCEVGGKIRWKHGVVFNDKTQRFVMPGDTPEHVQVFQVNADFSHRKHRGPQPKMQEVVSRDFDGIRRLDPLGFPPKTLQNRPQISAPLGQPFAMNNE